MLILTVDYCDTVCYDSTQSTPSHQINIAPPPFVILKVVGETRVLVLDFFVIRHGGDGTWLSRSLSFGSEVRSYVRYLVIDYKAAYHIILRTVIVCIGQRGDRMETSGGILLA